MKVVAIDGNSMVFRAYFAFAKSQLTNSEGLETGAIHGFVNMLTNIIENYYPDQIIVAFDLPEDTFRHELIQDYKGGRPETPESLIVQLLLIKEMLGLLGIPIYERPGYEADDVLATAATVVKEMGGHIIVVSGDRDIFQLVEDPFVKVLYPIKGLSQTSLFDESSIFEKTGVLPKDYPLFATLRGDPSDNLLGVSKVGEKTAAILTNEYGSLDAIYENLGKLRPVIAESFRDSRDRIYQIFEIVHLKKDLDIDFDFRPRYKSLSNRTELEKYFSKLQIAQSWQRLKNVLIQKNQSEPSAESGGDRVGSLEIPQFLGENKSNSSIIGSDNEDLVIKSDCESRLELLSTPEALGRVKFNRLNPQDFMKRFVETSGATCKLLATCKYMGEPGRSKLNWLAVCHVGDFKVGEQIKVEELKEAYYSVIDFNVDDDSNQAISDIWSRLRYVQLVGDSLKEIIRSLNQIRQCCPTTLFDLRIAAFLCDPLLAKFSNKTLLKALLGHGVELTISELQDNDSDASEKLSYSTANLHLDLSDSDNDSGYHSLSTLPESQFVADLVGEFALIVDSYNLLTSRLQKLNEMELFQNIEMPVSDCLAQMEIEGIMVDEVKLKSIMSDLESMRVNLTGSIFGLVGHQFNIGSPKQLSQVLYDELGLQSFRKTKTGRSTNANTLEKLRGLHPVVDLVLQYREVEKLRTTYGSALLNTVESDKRIHATFSLVSARTGRISSENPNLHNIPVRTALGQRFREVFVARPDCEFIIADYDQIELRLLAYYSKDVNLLSAFENKLDIHSYVASVVFGIPVEEIDKTKRNIAKMVSYGLVYGMEAFGLAERLTISVSEAKEILEKYFASFPGLRLFIDESIEQAKINGYVTTILGRRRIFDVASSMDRMQRLAMDRQAANSIIQGSAADLFKMAIIRLVRRLRLTEVDAAVVLQIHDEVIVECIKGRIEETVLIVKNEMESVSELGIPLTLHINTGSSWADKNN